MKFLIKLIKLNVILKLLRNVKKIMNRIKIIYSKYSIFPFLILFLYDLIRTTQTETFARASV